MEVNEKDVETILNESPFQILSVENIDDKITRLTVSHELHPDDEVQIDIVSKTENGEDVMEMNFTGPDVWTDEEAKTVLQQVMDILVRVIENAIEAELPEDESSEEGEQSSEN